MTATAPAHSQSLPLVELLDDYLSDSPAGLPPHLWEQALGEPAREFLQRPGKQFRARLVGTAWALCGRDISHMPPRLPHVVELLHAGSLIVDDIEDDSHTRRGGPALHNMYGVPLALNTGNWLYFVALRLVDTLELPAEAKHSLLREATTAVERCHRGQALDLALPISALSQAEIPSVVRSTTRLKTGALMELAATLGGIAADADEAQLSALRVFARALGEGLQMLDDLGGLTSPHRAHKAAEDLRNERPTWPWAWLANQLGTEEFDAFRKRLQKVSAQQESPDSLAALLRDAVAEPGRQRVHSSLHLCLAELSAAFGSSPAIGALRAEILRLEKSYE